jgi:imidazolonepropionase-like amidohydrolase
MKAGAAMKLKGTFRLVLAAALLALSSLIGQAQVTAIKAGQLVDPETGTVAVNQVILVEGQTIKAVGADLKIPEHATVMDLSQQTVLPGLFDAHTHLCLTTRRERDGGHYYFTTLIDSNAYRAIQGVANARSMLEAGFTTVRDVGNAGNKEYPRGRLSIETIDYWVEAGVPARLILQALTTNAARLLGVEKERGAIRAGLKADIIATADNPLDNIGTLKAVTFVMKNGQVFKPSK